jgi:hypothetical protein
MLFCDMLRPNLLQTFNPLLQECGKMDQWLQALGGTVYTNCYTPGPDTARSLACLYTGLYPKHNGCCKRIQYPKFYLNPNVPTLFDAFLDNGYHFVIRVTNPELDLGIFPYNITASHKQISIYNHLPETMEAMRHKLKEHENTFVFLSLSDYHWAMDDYGCNDQGDFFGQLHLSNACRMVFDEFPPDTFDYILIFSDHGCKSDIDFGRMSLPYLLNDDRSKIIMVLRQKGESSIRYCHNLTSIMDVFPTFNNLLHVPELPDRDGISLLSSSDDRFIVLEDHSVFSPEIDQIHDLWGLRTKEYFYLESFTEQVLLQATTKGQYTKIENPETDMIKYFQKQISAVSCSYAENKQQHMVLENYHKIIVVKDVYSDGISRYKPTTWSLFKRRCRTKLHLIISAVKRRLR